MAEIMKLFCFFHVWQLQDPLGIMVQANKVILSIEEPPQPARPANVRSAPMILRCFPRKIETVCFPRRIKTGYRWKLSATRCNTPHDSRLYVSSKFSFLCVALFAEIIHHLKTWFACRRDVISNVVSEMH